MSGQVVPINRFANQAGNTGGAQWLTTPAAEWWAGLEPNQRKFLIREAEQARALASKPWEALSPWERGQVLFAVQRTLHKFSDMRRLY
jgi:hypothetical protein